MKHSIIKFISRILISLLLLGIVPIPGATGHTSTVLAQSKKKKKKKKKSSSKKKSSKKKKSASKKKKKSARKKKSSSKKKSSKKNKSASKPTNSINTVAMADELYSLTGQLEASNKELARATRYLYTDESKKKVIAIESRPFFSTKDYESEAQRNPNNIQVQRRLGLHYESKRDFESAKDVYLTQITRYPQNPDAHYFLGALYATIGEYQKAQWSFDEALDLDSNHKATIETMSLFGQTQEERAFSKGVLLKSSQKNPDGPANKLNIIRDRLNQGNYAEALHLAQDAQEKFPTHNGFVFLAGKAQEKMGNYDDAKSNYQRSIKLNAKEKESHVALANLYFEQGKYVYAALSYSDVVYVNPEDQDARYMQGLSYFNAKEWGRAAAAWEDLLVYAPNNALVRNLLPQTYYVLAVENNRLGNPALGRRSFQNALSVNTNSHEWLPGAMATLGKYYREKRMYKESLSAYQEVLELRPNDANGYLGMGVTYWKMNEKQLAKASWQRTLEIDPENNEAKSWLVLSAR